MVSLAVLSVPSCVRLKRRVRRNAANEDHLIIRRRLMDRPQTGVLITVSILSGMLGGIVATCLVGGGLVTAQEPAREVPAVVSAKEFRLIDRQGHTRAALSFNEDGQPFLQMRDEFDTERVRVGISRETGVDVRDVDGKTRLVLSVDEEGFPSLVVRDRKHQTKSFHP
jgi:hypothetical protein